MHQSAMTLSKEFAPEVLNADTHMTSIPSSTTHAIPVKATTRHSCAMTTASKQCILLTSAAVQPHRAHDAYLVRTLTMLACAGDAVQEVQHAVTHMTSLHSLQHRH